MSQRAAAAQDNDRLAWLPDGYSLDRPSTDVLDELVELARACDLAYIGVADFSAEDVLAWLSAPYTRSDEDGWIVRDTRGRLVAWSYLESHFGNHNEEATMYVLPEVDRGLIPPLLDALVQRSAERARTAGRPDSRLVLWCTPGEIDLAEAVGATGATHARRFVRMTRRLDELPSSEVQIPPGVTLHGVSSTDVDTLHAFHGVVAAAWGDSPNSRAAAYESWIAHIEAAEHTPYDEWLIASVDGKPVGVLQTTDFSTESLGWVRNVAVLEEFRGRGVARALLSTVFVTFARKGYASAGLVVDLIDGEDDSLRLYESVGMTLLYNSDAWQLTVPAA